MLEMRCAFARHAIRPILILLATGCAGPASGQAAGTVTVRFVNLWAADGAGADIDIYRGFRPDPSERVVQALAPGEVSEPFPIEERGMLAFYIAGDPDRRITSVSGAALEGGATLTLVLRAAPPPGNAGIAGAVDVFRDTGDSLGPGHGPARSVAGALLVTNVSAAGTALGERTTFFFGAPGAGCLRPAGAGGASAASTASASYDVPPGTLPVAAYAGDDPDCARSPVIGPITVVAPAGRRTYLFAWGTGPGDLRLTAVPAAR